MKRNQRIELEINKTLDLLEEDNELQHNPFFYSQLQERMEGKTSSGNAFGVLQPILLASLLIVNLITAVSYLNTETVEEGTTNNNPLNVFADDFSLDQDQNNLFFIE